MWRGPAQDLPRTKTLTPGEGSAGRSCGGGQPALLTPTWPLPVTAPHRAAGAWDGADPGAVQAGLGVTASSLVSPGERPVCSGASEGEASQACFQSRARRENPLALLAPRSPLVCEPPAPKKLGFFAVAQTQRPGPPSTPGRRAVILSECHTLARRWRRPEVSRADPGSCRSPLPPSCAQSSARGQARPALQVAGWATAQPPPSRGTLAS